MMNAARWFSVCVVATFIICVISWMQQFSPLYCITVSGINPYKTNDNDQHNHQQVAPTLRVSPPDYHGSRVIPRIIHQTWSSHEVPVKFSTWIRSWLKYNPDWEYWFWGPAEVHALIRSQYGEDYENIYDSYDLNLKRADALRYFVLSQFGGVYADLDMECLKPLDRFISNHSCFVTEENIEHVVFLHRFKDPVVMNCIMGCYAGHPLYKALVRGLNESSAQRHVFNATGPFYFTKTFLDVRESLPYGGNISVLHPRFMLPRADDWAYSVAKQTCRSFQLQGIQTNISQVTNSTFLHDPPRHFSKTRREQLLCAQLQRRNFVNSINDEALTTHHWVHTVMKEKHWKEEEEKINIETLVPGVKFYGGIFDGY